MKEAEWAESSCVFFVSRGGLSFKPSAYNDIDDKTKLDFL